MFSLVKQSVAGLQILFVAFGAMVLVPLLTGLNPSMALLGAGVGTLLFQLCTRRQVPIFLGSSFAFIAPIIYATQTWGLPSTMFVSIHRNSIDTGKMRRSSLDPTFLLA